MAGAAVAAVVVSSLEVAAASSLFIAGVTGVSWGVATAIGSAVAGGASYLISSGVNSLIGSGGGGDAPAAFAPASTNSNYFTAQANTRTHILRTTIANRQIVYGQAMLSGPLVFAHSNDHYGTLHLAIALANHECEEIGAVYFNDESLGTLDANGYPTAGRYYLPVVGGNIVEVHQVDQPPVYNQLVWGYVTLDQTAFQIVSITDSGGAWSLTTWDSVPGVMGKVSPSDPGVGTIPLRYYALQNGTLKLSPFVGNVTVTYRTASGDQSYYARVRKHLGSVDQIADAELAALGAGWTAEHRLRGVSYIVASLVWSQTKYPRGIPNIKAIVKGKKLYDPRTGLTVWSDNPALVIRDYLVSGYGLGCASSEIDDASFITAANICDGLVTLLDATTQKRYTANGVVDTGQRPTDVLRAMVSSCAGMLVWQGGTWRLHAGAYAAPVGVTLTADDLRGALRVDPRVSRDKLFNAVKGTFIDPDRGWLPQDYPAQRNGTYITQDGGEEIFSDMTLPMTVNVYEAQRLARIALERARQGIVVRWPGKPNLLAVAVGDVKTITLPHLGWTAKEFRVVDWALDPTGAVDLLLQEEASASYDWNAGMATVVDPAPDTNIPSPFDPPAAPGAPLVSEGLYEVSGSVGVRSSARVSWFASDSPYIIDYVLEHRSAGASSWVSLPGLMGMAVDLFDLPPGLREFRVKAVNAYGIPSAWATTTVDLMGLTAPPGDVSAFYVVASTGYAQANWALTADLDVKIGGRVVIRHSPLTVGASWLSGIILDELPGSAVAATLPLMTGTYMAKFKDSSGNYSTTAASFVANEAYATGWATVGTTTQQPAFTGAKTNTAVFADTLRLDSSSLISDMTGLMSTWPKIGSLGGVSGAGSYEFDAAVDMTTIAVRRFDATIAATSLDTGDVIGARGLVSTWDAIGGSVVNDCDATLYIATTDDDPAGTPTWSGWVPFFVGDFSCRAAKFRLDLASGSPTHNIAVDTLSVRARIPA